MLCLPYYAYVFSTIKLEIFCLDVRGRGKRMGDGGKGEK
jgi:hypothetical protein